MDHALHMLADMEFTYGDRDPEALAELAGRIAAVGRTPDQYLIYSQLVEGVTFRLPNVAGGEPFEIEEWTHLNRAILGSFLGRIAADSYRRGRFLASALVIGFVQNAPSEGFYDLATYVGLLRSNREDARLRFWFEQAGLARAWYTAHPG
jgi:hypothetical protein